MDNLQNLQKGGSFKVKTGSSDGLSLRSEPTTKATTMDGKEKNIILSIPNGAKVTLESGKVQTSDKHTWYNVRYTDKDKKDVTGWVASDYLEDLRPTLPTLSWSALWDNRLADQDYPCDKKAFPNQCAIRIGVALEQALKGTGVSLDSFDGVWCWQKLDEKHDRRHILRAQELADWLTKPEQTKLVGKVQITGNKSYPADAYRRKKGIVFFQNIPTNNPKLKGIDHIELWWGPTLEKDHHGYFGKCEQVWFWDLWPCITKADNKTGSLTVYPSPDVTSSPLKYIIANRPVEVIKVEENWVTVNLTKYKDHENVVSEEGFIKREFVLIPDQYLAA